MSISTHWTARAILERLPLINSSSWVRIQDSDDPPLSGTVFQSVTNTQISEGQTEISLRRGFFEGFRHIRDDSDANARHLQRSGRCYFRENRWKTELA